MTEQQTLRTAAELIQAGELMRPTLELSQNDKESLADAGAVFSISSAAFGDDEQYGSYYEFTGQLDADPIRFIVWDKPQYSAWYQALASATEHGPIGGLRFEARGKGRGNRLVTIAVAS